MEARFCGNCGAVLAPSSGPAAPSPAAAAPTAPVLPPNAPPAPMRTMFGAPQFDMPGGGVPPAPAAAPPAPAPVAPPAPVSDPFAQNTATSVVAPTVPAMPAMPVPAASFGPAAPAPPPAAPPPAAPPPAARPMPVAAAHKTMLGMAMDFANAPPGVAAPPGPASAVAPPGAPAAAPNGSAAGPAAVRSAHKTMLGVSLSPPAGAMPSPQPHAGAPQPGAPGGPVAVANANRTMLGMQISEAPPAIGGPARSRHETPPMIGGIAPGVPPATEPPMYGGHPPPAGAYNPVGGAYATDPSLTLPQRRSRAPVIFGVIALVGVLGALAFGAYTLFNRAPAGEAPLQAAVQASEGGALTMTITLPNMPPGTVVRHGGTQQTLDAAGTAQLPLAISSGQVGRIDVPIEIVPPNAAPQRRTARVVLAYRVAPDLSHLADERPQLRLVFRVEPGSRLVVNNQEVRTDATTGEGTATIDNVAPMPVDGPDTLRSPFNVQVTARDGTVATGVYELRVPRTPLAVDRPVNGAMTTADRIVVRGRAPHATRVTVNGAPARVEGDAFSAVMPVPAPGHQAWTVVASSRDGAPAVSRLEFDRVAPTDRAAPARYLGASHAGAAEVARNALTVGQRVRLHGRVLAAPIERDGGQTFQLVVTDRPCEPGHCVVWVDTDPGVAPQANATVEVVGVASGRRSSTTSSGPRNDPVVQAAFVM